MLEEPDSITLIACLFSYVRLCTDRGHFEAQNKGQVLINLDFDTAESNTKSVSMHDNLATILKF